MTDQICILTPDDAAVYQALRLRALQEHPEAFGSSYEDEVQRSLEVVASRLQATPNGFMLGAWWDGAMVGLVGLHRAPGIKVRHRGGVGGMYIAPEARGQGIGKALVKMLIDRAPTLQDLEEIILAVTVGNVAARSIYVAAGFEPSHVEKRYIKIDDRYYDIEWMTLGLLER